MVGERGSAGVVLLAAAVVVLLLTLAVVAVGQYLAGYSRARAAADAAALAAAPVTFRPFGAEGSPLREARIFAGANGAELVSCDCGHDPSWEPRTVVVTVRRVFPVLLLGSRSVRATARAEFVPTRLLE
ncbi:MAG: Rv3654c family TadE-like protein [Acidimicrobiia bacterium]